MAIKKYTNFEEVNAKTNNEGQYLQADDLFIVSKSEIDTTEFGECKYDVMEVSVYDINNNLLPQKSGNNVAYIKTGDIKNYMYQITNKVGLKELAIDIEKLLKDLGFTNGILKTNINFVRYKVGSENELERVWIEEISPSREEIRIIPLKTKFDNVNKKTIKQVKDLQSLNKDFKYYKETLLNSLNSFDNTFLDKINSNLETKYGKDFFNTVKKDFGLSNFNSVRDKISSDFKLSVNYYLNNRYYDASDSLFGKPSETRFDDCEVYDFNSLLSELQNILNNCVNFNLQSLKRRELNLKVLPKEFAITELQKQIQNNLDSFKTFTETKRNVYSPDGTINVFNDATSSFVEVAYIKKGTLLNTFCKGYDQYGSYADGNGGSYEELIQLNSPVCGYTLPDPIDGELPGGGLGSGGPAGGRGDEFMGGTGGTIGSGGTGGGGGSRTRYEYDTLDRQNLGDGGMGREPMEFQ
jgi:hypothetical protein